MTTDDAIRRDLTGTVAAVLVEADAPGATVALVADGQPVLEAGVEH